MKLPCDNTDSCPTGTTHDYFEPGDIVELIVTTARPIGEYDEIPIPPDTTAVVTTERIEEAHQIGVFIDALDQIVWVDVVDDVILLTKAVA